ncbi:hypothetical protein D9613_010251 [Agrocybe pediades]|uniref:Nephrocystin 3-like N-terminal domain-containing protein n=1 Tax=Agrocybe pediades TaxID=84607 RepID=A0A8H4QG38_9AGAR|nr:hypothetical protein D9613_010251 [Agrocybe pediades]
MFAGSKNVVVSGGTFVMQGEFHSHNYINPSGERGGLIILQNNIAPGAFHNSSERYDPPKCHPQTREAVLRKIMDWAQGKAGSTSPSSPSSPSDSSSNFKFLWLYGPAGTGKSAIAQTIAEKCHEAGLLLGTFFFARSVAGRNEKTRVVSTLLYQMVLAVPEMREEVLRIMEVNPQIFNLSLKTQVAELIVGPLNALHIAWTQGMGEGERERGMVVSRRSSPRLIIVDGLDECVDIDAQSYILEVLVSVVEKCLVPLKILVASRPEQQIRDSFNEDVLTALTTRIVLDDTYRPDADIRILLESKFGEIKKKHPARAHIPAAWPEDKDIKKLVEKSSGQFIYTSTVIKYIESRRHLPTERLKVVLGLSTPSGKNAADNTPFAELDALYKHVLSSTYDQESTLNLFTVLLITERMDTAADIGNFLFLRPGEIDIILSELHSLVVVPAPEDVKGKLRMTHASLGDFLMDRERAGEKWFIDVGTANAEVLILVMRHLVEDKEKDLDYDHWSRLFDDHYKRASPTANLLDELLAFDLESLLDFITKDGNPAPDAVRPATGYWSKAGVDDRWPNMSQIFHWLHNLRHPNPTIDFHKFYLSQFDTWMHAQLARYYPVQEPSTTHLLSAISLDFFRLEDGYTTKRIYELIHAVCPWKDFDTLTWKDPLRLYDRYYKNPNAGVYYSEVGRFLTTKERAGVFFVDEEKIGALGCLVLEYFFMQNPHSLTKDSNMTYLAAFPLKMLSTFVDRVMQAPSAKEYFRAHPVRCVDNQNPLYEEMNELANKIESYL